MILQPGTEKVCCSCPKRKIGGCYITIFRIAGQVELINQTLGPIILIKRHLHKFIGCDITLTFPILYGESIID